MPEIIVKQFVAQGAAVALSRDQVMHNFFRQRELALPNVQVVKEIPHTMQSFWYIRKGLAGMEMMSKAVLECSAYGFTIKYLEQPLPMEARQKWKPKLVKDETSLTLNHLLFPIVFWSAGIVVASIAFIFELTRF